MATNPLPTTCSQLCALGITMSSGLVSLGATLGITQVTPVAFQSALTAFSNADNAFNAARTNRGAASAAQMGATDELMTWLLKARTVLAGRLGLRWSEAWVEAGFTNASTAIPRNAEGQVALAASLTNYFTVHPDFQVGSMEVTAARASALRDAVLLAESAWMMADIAAKSAKTVRTTAGAALTVLMRNVIKALQIALAPMDPRWEQFGLNLPGADTTPGQPQGVHAYVNPQGGISVLCAPVALATRYRWRMQIVGVDAQPRLAVSSPTPDAVIAEVLPGQVVDIFVQAVNGSSQGVASDTVRVALSARAGKETATALAAPLFPVPSSNGNGNGNGAHASGRAGTFSR